MDLAIYVSNRKDIFQMQLIVSICIVLFYFRRRNGVFFYALLSDLNFHHVLSKQESKFNFIRMNDYLSSANILYDLLAPSGPISTLTAIGSDSIKVDVLPPLDDGGYPIKSYRVSLRFLLFSFEFVI